MSRSNCPLSFWQYVVQALVGFFFIGAAVYKLNIGVYASTDSTLGTAFDFWLSQGFPLGWYADFMIWVRPHIVLLGTLVALMQGSAGIMLICNVRIRWAALLLSFVQLNIFLATLHNRGFNSLVGISLWVALYLYYRPVMTKNRWAIFTLLFIVVCMISSYNRYLMDDPWLSAVAWQRTDYIQNVMTVSLPFKHMFLMMTDGRYGTLLWASMWWLHLALVFSLFTQLRLYTGTLLLLFLMGRSIFWMNAITSEGVLWVLAMFVWMVQEEYRVRTGGSSHLFDSWKDWRQIFRYVRMRRLA